MKIPYKYKTQRKTESKRLSVFGQKRIYVLYIKHDYINFLIKCKPFHDEILIFRQMKLC